MNSASENDEKKDIVGKRRKAIERNKKGPQTCVVCGEAATGFHYQAASCYRCKAFFRRMILNAKMMHCNKGGGCIQPDLTGAKRCRACRFYRCVEGGMNPLCIDSEGQPEDNPLFQEVLKMRKDLHSSSTPSPSSETASIINLDMLPKSPEMITNRLIDELIFLEFAHEKIRSSSFAPAPEDGLPLTELIKGHSKFAEDYWDKPSASSEQPLDPRVEGDDLCSCEMPESCGPSQRKSVSSPENKRKVWPHADLVYAIEYLKTFEFFHQLSDNEKLHLVRCVVPICAHLNSSYFSHNMKSCVTIYPDGSTMSQKCIASSPRIREYHFDSIERIRDLKMNEKEYVLLKATIVCDPAIDGLSDYSRTKLDEQRTRYVKSLFSYMSTKRGPQKAPGQFLEMLKLIDWFRGMNERRKERHLLRAAAGLLPNESVAKLIDEIYL